MTEIEALPAGPGCDGWFRRALDRHFAAEISPADEHRLREHLPGCAACRTRYERYLLLTELDPEAKSPALRLAVGLGLAPRAASVHPLRAGLAAAALVAGIAAAAVFGISLRAGERSEFRARGGELAVREAELAVHLVTPEGDLVPLFAGAEGRPPRDAELAFAYTNPRGRRYLAIFARDEHGHVFWYYPAWTDANATPLAIAIEAGGTARRLPDAVRHEFDAPRVELYAVFSDRRWSVRELEARLESVANPTGALSLPDSFIWRRTLELEAK